MTNILIVDKNVDFCKKMKNYLDTHLAANCELVHCVDDLFGKLSMTKYDVLILDLEIFKRDEIDMLPLVKRNHSGAIIVISRLKNTFNKVMSLRNGADDYVTKPLALEELTLRIEKLLYFINNTRILYIGDCCIDEVNRIVYVKNRRLNINNMAYDTLVLIVKNKGDVVSRGQLCKTVWGMELMDSRVVDNTIAKIRKEAPELKIKTKRGIGYIYE